MYRGYIASVDIRCRDIYVIKPYNHDTLKNLNFSERSYWYNKANLFTLLIELSKIDLNKLNLGKLEIELLSLEDKVDRYFNAEKILGILHLLGAVLMYFMYQSSAFDSFYILVLVYMILYMPTLALVNSVSFNQMKNPAKEFSMVRVFGTAGWIIAGLSISYVFSWDQGENIGQGLLKNTFLMTAIASLILGFFSFTLPKTPPKAASSEKLGLKEILGLDSLSLFKDKNFLIFFISSVLICIPLAFYYQNANPFLVEIGMDNPTGKMTLGQIFEIAIMLLLPYFFAKFGFNKLFF